jgi:hypothetical protein
MDRIDVPPRSILLLKTASGDRSILSQTNNKQKTISIEIRKGDSLTIMKNKQIKSLTDWGFLVDDAYESAGDGEQETQSN